MKFTKFISLILISIFAMASASAQNEDPILPLKVAPQNLLKYNRFLINPTFSTVREDKSYINFLHRNQSVQFDNNDQTYFLSYSGRIGDRSGLGLSVYSQRVGLVSNIGIMANYAYGVKLSDKSNFTFGGNLAYYNTGFDRNNASPLDPNDQAIFFLFSPDSICHTEISILAPMPKTCLTTTLKQVNNLQILRISHMPVTYNIRIGSTTNQVLWKMRD